MEASATAIGGLSWGCSHWRLSCGAAVLLGVADCGGRVMKPAGAGGARDPEARMNT